MLVNVDALGKTCSSCKKFKGYTSDNIQIISRLANAMKFNATPKEMVQFATSVLELHTQGG